MKLLIFAAALFGLWISVYSASIMVPDGSFQPMMAFQNECIAKIQNDKEIVANSVGLKYSFLTTFMRISQKVREQHSLEDLDNIIEKTCYPAADENLIYDVVMSIIKSCVEQEFSFTEEEKLIIKEKLEKIFCNVYIKLAAIISFSPECVSDPGTVQELQKCSQGQTMNMQTPVRDWFFGNSEICKTQLKAIECLNETIKGKCSSNISKQIESVLVGARSIIGCASEPNSVSVVELS